MELPDVLTSAPGVRAAELLIDGLSVFCFNQINEEKFWEVAYPRLAQHELKITIQELDGSGQPVGAQQVHAVDQGIKSFNISLTNGSLEHFTQFPLGGPRDPNFNRNNPAAPDDNPHDLGWMVDLAGPELRHGNAVLLPGDLSRPISLARIRHSLFCNLKPEAEEVRISPIFQGHPNSTDSFSLPLNNTEIVGVLLGTAPGQIIFESDPMGALTIDPLPYSQAQRYEIEIRNEDMITPWHLSPFVRGDVFRFYHVVINVDGVEKDLWAHENHIHVDPDGDCHSTFISKPTLESLIHP
jgi:hypothetical protein